MADRLSTIEENPLGPGASRHAAKQNHTPNRSRASTLPRASAESKPPSYSREWQSSGANYPEKTSFGHGLRSRLGSSRGGWGKVVIFALALLLVIIALAVGLGVGLTRRHGPNASEPSTSSNGTQPSTTTQQFPLGDYSLITALQDVQTNCTSNSATWRCYPYSTYSDANSTAGLTIFNWVLTSLDASFASNSTTQTTDAAGVPANISLSSASNPFTMTITNQSLTYVNNDSMPRYTFSYTYRQTVIPTTAIDPADQAATCLYNSTVLSATLYLSDNSPVKSYPGAALAGSASVSGGYTPWPYAVEITESVAGGTDVPACYATTNGVLGAPIGSFTPESSDAQCQCLYSNYS